MIDPTLIRVIILFGSCLVGVVLFIIAGVVYVTKNQKNTPKQPVTTDYFSEPSNDVQPAVIYPYYLNQKFLSFAEQNFLHVLEQVTENKAAIFAKVNLGDLFYVKHQKWGRYRAKIDRKHVDFLICHPKTYKPVLAIELDDSSHNNAKAKARDEFKDTVFKAAGLPLLRVPVQHTYNTKELQQVIIQTARNGR